MFTEYNRAGIYPWADADIVPAVTEISRAAGVPGISVSCYQAGGVGHHKTGRAADFQAGSGPEARDIHTAIARYALDNWDRLNIRYLAWDGWEYGGNYGGPERKRRQQEEAWHASATDPWHARHVHVDFLPGTIPGARPDIRIGAGLVATMSNPALGRVSSEYGWRPRLTLKIKAMFHAGLDIANRTGTPVHAAFAGTVEKAGWNVVPGRTGIGILIRNPDGERQYYGHLSKLRVRAGQVVALGERIGDMGSTGNVTGPHLHFEVWNRTGATLNPRAAFKNHGVNPGVDAPAGPDRKPERVLRTYYGRAVDGQPGHYTYRALQSFLAKPRWVTLDKS